MPTNALPTPSRKRYFFKKRIFIPLFLLTLFPIAFLLLWVRGSQTRAMRIPTHPNQGVLCSVVQEPDGKRSVDCALVVDKSLENIWKTVTNYERFPAIFPHLLSIHATQPIENNWKVKGVATTTKWDHWPFELDLVHQFSPNQAMILWHHPFDAKTQSRGFWKLTPLSPNQTRVEYKTLIHVPRCPDFLMNNILLHEIPHFLEAVSKNTP